MAEKLKAGDVVQLKSGGPKMTVDVAETMMGKVYCTWFVGSKREGAEFASESLELVQSDKPSR
jgi:uncharacterized protein YodC (DUF2158 family)